MTHPNDDELPDAVADLFSRDGQWSQTRDSLFYFTCECGNSAVCHCERDEEEDVWIRECSTKQCEWHGKHEFAYGDIDEEEAKRRHKRNKEFEDKSSSLISEIEHFLGIAAIINSPDTDDAAFLDQIMDDVIRKYVFIGRDEAIVLTLWAVHTWCLAAAEFTPYIHLRSALPREGKSRVLDVLHYIVARPVRMSDPTPAAITDLITAADAFGIQAPTFLWDEIDSAYERWAALREYVNNGFQRGNPVIRARGVVKQTFAPKVMAGLTELPTTVADRSFRFDMARAKRDETPERLTPRERRALQRQGEMIQVRLGAFAERHMERLMSSEPELPAELDDRAQDIAEPLLAIADVTGGDWATKARKAMVKIRLAQQMGDSVSTQEMLIRDIRDVFGSLRPRIYSEDLVAKLVKKEDRPWRSMGLNQWKLARLLHNFVEYPGGPRIASRRLRVGGRKVNAPLKAGYDRKQFEDAWTRYLTEDDQE